MVWGETVGSCNLAKAAFWKRSIMTNTTKKEEATIMATIARTLASAASLSNSVTNQLTFIDYLKVSTQAKVSKAIRSNSTGKHNLKKSDNVELNEENTGTQMTNGCSF